MTMTVGEAAMQLLRSYGVDTVFGIPGVHTLEFYRGLGTESGIHHVQARNEMGAGFMADGYGRSCGRPGVTLLISGPGVINAATPLGNAYADSVPMLLLSSDAQSESLGKGWGVLHEVTDLHAVTRPLTALSRQVRAPEDVPDLFAQAFSIFRSERPRPVHISIPLDVLGMAVSDKWTPVHAASLTSPNSTAIYQASELLRLAKQPVIMVGGGAAGADITRLAETLGAITIASTAGKGIVSDDHPLSLSASTVRPEARALIAKSDVILAVGTELSETDSFVDRLELNGKLIRIDIDPRKMNDLYAADIAILSDATAAVDALQDTLSGHRALSGGANAVMRVRQEITENLKPTEAQHDRLLSALRTALPPDCMVMADACQLTYTGAFRFPTTQPRRWHYGAGFCPLGYALPNAIGAKLANPSIPVAVIAGDGGAMYTIQELVTAAELHLAIPVIIWENNGLQEIRENMRDANISRIGVDGVNPDFLMVAEGMLCNAVEPHSVGEFTEFVTDALSADRPTVIVVKEGARWLS